MGNWYNGKLYSSCIGEPLLIHPDDAIVFSSRACRGGRLTIVLPESESWTSEGVFWWKTYNSLTGAIEEGYQPNVDQIIRFNVLTDGEIFLSIGYVKYPGVGLTANVGGTTRLPDAAASMSMEGVYVGFVEGMVCAIGTNCVSYPRPQIPEQLPPVGDACDFDPGRIVDDIYSRYVRVESVFRDECTKVPYGNPLAVWLGSNDPACLYRVIGPDSAEVYSVWNGTDCFFEGHVGWWYECGQDWGESLLDLGSNYSCGVYRNLTEPTASPMIPGAPLDILVVPHPGNGVIYRHAHVQGDPLAMRASGTFC